MQRTLILVTVLVSAIGVAMAQDALEESPRMTPLVSAVQEASPGVVDITGFAPIEGYEGSYTLSWGTGSVLHESGFMVTNAHVASDAGQQVVTLVDGRQYPYRVICESAGQDIAIIKADSDEAFEAIKLGRSHDVMLGETVIVIGNPGGLAHTVTTGIVSGLGRVTGADNAFLTGTIQTDAAINGGNSGGPMINLEGEQIGIVVAKKLDTEGLGFAIPIDRLREILPTMLSAEMRYGYELGLDVDTFGPAVVTAVAPESPAALAGLQVGDEITSFGGMTITDGVHFYLALAERKAGETLAVKFLRTSADGAGGGGTVELTLTAIPPLPAAAVDVAELDPGVWREVFTGQWKTLPDFDAIEPGQWGVSAAIDLADVQGLTDNFGVTFDGYLHVPETGLYTFYTTSDDGSQLFLDEELVVTNDGLHGAIESGGMVRLEAGLHAIKVTYFEAGGDQVLSVSYEGPGIDKQVIAPEALFTRRGADVVPAGDADEAASE